MYNARMSSSVFVLDITSDTLTRSDIDVLPGDIENALAAGITNIVASITVGSLSNHSLISSLLLKCREITTRCKANLVVVEKDSSDREIYGMICHNLQIPRYALGINDTFSFAREGKRIPCAKGANHR